MLIRRTAVTALVLGALVACGAQTDSPPDQGQADDLPATAQILQAVTKDDALAARLPAAVAQAGTLKVGSNIQNPPNNFYAADGTTPVGSEVDLIKAVGAKLGLRVEHQDMAFSSLITSLQAGRIDVTMAAMNDTAERQRQIDFVDYFTSGITIMVQKGNPSGVKGPDDLCGKAVAVNLGTSQEAFAKEQSGKCAQAGRGEVTVTSTDSDTQNQNQLRTGRVAAILNDLPTAVYVAKTAGGGEFFEVVPGTPINGGPYGIGVNKNTPELAAAVQQALQALVDDGTYGKILDAWGVSQGAVAKVTLNGR
ncbi:ABC transporter substrate-binding protein [Saccharothrix coeruleofusca]|uniref:ABC transporter substrate-binding protein n=1 Tax=Saccharothrix coeruleofusca TaxID=33919 RepID=A0A918EGW1_9PSEU|nr:ABC transporter substrate-binding protein [Saccharothrix coeruleofusca]MBP2335242.1 polar amino acid transport system substrate-binding protein [Saccharothrix coeruleofusca]GGP71744.1 ABC transporter substrate-binding protein [Saccharothrix coeruleofusca]